ncbi:hypothetical protein TNCV_124211 [Trichonephila clavipes]|nr:hypothetical protein TNCV_124211 [Trichonephila clavipes]
MEAFPNPVLTSNRTIRSIKTRLRTEYVKGMKISTDRQRSYTNNCSKFPNVQLSPQHILSCPAIQARLFKICPKDPDYLIFSDKAVEVVKADLCHDFECNLFVDEVATTREKKKTLCSRIGRNDDFSFGDAFLI